MTQILLSTLLFAALAGESVRFDQAADPVQIFKQICMEGGARFSSSTLQPINAKQLPSKIKSRFSRIVNGAESYVIATNSGPAYLSLSAPNSANLSQRTCLFVAKTDQLKAIAVTQPNGVVRPEDMRFLARPGGYSALSNSGYQTSITPIGGGQIAMSTTFLGQDGIAQIKKSLGIRSRGFSSAANASSLEPKRK